MLLACGIAAAGSGIALLLRSGFGITPIDAVVAGISSRTGISVGTALIAVCAVLVLASWRLGQSPGIGTLMSFVLIGVCVDAALHVLDAAWPGIAAAPWQGRTLTWLVGACLLALAASGLYASGLGASPYDLFVQSSGRFGLSIPVARLIMDAVMFVIAWLIGGAWGVGTVGLLALLPFLIRYLLPRAERFAAQGRPTAVNSRRGVGPVD